MSEWISVDDNYKPQGGCEILIAYNNSYDKFSGITVGKYVNFGFYSKMSSYRLQGATHWMPLPEPPEEV